MKKIFNNILLAGVALALTTSCDSDRDNNPTLLSEPSAIELNVITDSAEVIDLQTSESLHLSWSRPVVATSNAPLVVQYQVAVATSPSFSVVYDATAEDNSSADYQLLADVYTSCEADLDAADVNRAIEELNGWTAEDVPDFQTVYFKVFGAVRNADNAVLSATESNVVSHQFIPYYMELANLEPEIWYLTGSCIGNASWGNDVPTGCFPMQTDVSEIYDPATGHGNIFWVGYLTPDGFKLRGATDDGWATQWGQGDAFGSFVKNDGGSSNIAVPEAGVYKVTLNTATDELSVTEYSGTVHTFSGIAIAGTINDWTDTEMLPVHTYAGAENHDWYIELTLSADDEVKFKEVGSWDYNKGSNPITYSAGFYGYGETGGANIVVPADGTYLIIFNDITGFYRFIQTDI